MMYSAPQRIPCEITTCQFPPMSLASRGEEVLDAIQVKEERVDYENMVKTVQTTMTMGGEKETNVIYSFQDDVEERNITEYFTVLPQAMQNSRLEIPVYFLTFIGLESHILGFPRTRLNTNICKMLLFGNARLKHKCAA